MRRPAMTTSSGIPKGAAAAISVVRPYREADRAATLAFLGDGRAIDAPRNHVFLSGGDTPDGVALWAEPPERSAEPPHLGAVVTNAAGTNARFYDLVLACARDALDRGYERGSFTIKNRGLLRVLQATFRIEPVAVGWEAEGRMPAEWEVRVDLRDAVDQLDDVIDALRGTAA
jgi:hypothetical protein